MKLLKVLLLVLLATPAMAGPNAVHVRIGLLTNMPDPQTNTFCAANLSCTITGNWSLTGSNAINCKKIETMRCVDNANTQGWTGANVGAWIDSAGADCGGNTCQVMIASDAVDGNPSTPLANVLYLDYRPKGTGDGPNEVALNVWDGTPINNQAGSTGAYARSMLTCGRIIPASANKSFSCVRSYMFLPTGQRGLDTGDAATTSIVLTNGTDTITNQGFENALEPEIFFGNNASVSNLIYDIRGVTTNVGASSIAGTGTVGNLRLIDTQPWTSPPAGLHFQKWIGYNAENPAIPAANMTATGTVNCNGTSTVTWVSGDKFTDRGMLGYPITINGTVYTVATVPAGGTTLTVNSATGGATTCPTVSGTAFTFNGNIYSEIMNGNVWLRGDQSASSPSDSNGSGGIILDSNGSNATAKTAIAFRDTNSRNADGTYKRIYVIENNGFLEFHNQAFNAVAASLSDGGNWNLGGALLLNETGSPGGNSGIDNIYGDSTAHAVAINYNNGGFTNFLPKTIALTADWTCGTGGTVASCTSATIIGSGGGVPLTFPLPLTANSLTLECNGVVGQATGATANQWNLLTATNGATNVTATYDMATAATAAAFGAVTDQASTTTTFQITPSWTLGGTGTKMPFHIWAKIEGASASGTVVSLQLLAPTVGDLVTIYRGTSCRIF